MKARCNLLPSASFFFVHKTTSVYREREMAMACSVTEVGREIAVFLNALLLIEVPEVRSVFNSLSYFRQARKEKVGTRRTSIDQSIRTMVFQPLSEKKKSRASPRSFKRKPPFPSEPFFSSFPALFTPHSLPSSRPFFTNHGKSGPYRVPQG